MSRPGTSRIVCRRAQKLGVATLAGILAGVLMGGKAGPAIASGAAAAGLQKQLAYSREDERQSDQMGFQYMSRSGFDPGGMIDTLAKLEKGQWHGADVVPPYLLTHPGGTERIANIESMLSTSDRKEVKDQAKKLRDLFPYFKAVVQARSGEPHDMETLYRKALERIPRPRLHNSALGWSGRRDPSTTKPSSPYGAPSGAP